MNLDLRGCEKLCETPRINLKHHFSSTAPTKTSLVDSMIDYDRDILPENNCTRTSS